MAAFRITCMILILFTSFGLKSQNLSDCSLSPGNSFFFEDTDGNITYIFEEAGNVNLRPPHVLAQKRYRYIPPFKVKWVDIRTARDSGMANVRVVFVPIIPDHSILFSYIKQEINPRIQKSNLEVACIEGYSLRYFSDTFKEEDLSTSAFNKLSVFFKVPFHLANEIRSDFQRGIGIELSFKVLMKYACNSQIDLKNTFDQLSSTIRDFSQESEFNGVNYDVTGFNLFRLDNSVKRYIKGKIILDCVTDTTDPDIFDTFFKEILASGVDRTIGFEVLEKEDALININGDHYKPDVVRQIAVDAKELSHKEFHDKWKHDFKEKKSAEGKGSIDIVKIFNMSGNAKSSSEREDLKYSEQDFKDIWEGSFSYSWNGEKWIPKGIKVYDNISLDNSDELKEEFDKQLLQKEFRFVRPFIITEE